MHVWWTYRQIELIIVLKSDTALIHQVDYLLSFTVTSGEFGDDWCLT